MKQGAESKLKFKKLQRRLSLTRWQCTGLLETLWQVTCQNAWLGDIGKLSNEDIAAVLEWEENADDLVSALVDTGWIDPSDEHRLVIHHWADHCPNHIKANAAKHGHSLCVSSPRDVPREVPIGAPRDENTPPISLPPSQAKSSQANSSPAKPKPSLSAKPTPQELIIRELKFVKAWNALDYVTKNRGTGLLAKRRINFRARLKDNGWSSDCWDAFKKFPLAWSVESGWKPDIEWILKPDSVAKVLEGKYDKQVGEQQAEGFDIDELFNEEDE